MDSTIKYIELKTDGLRGVGRIGRVERSKTGKTLYYKERSLVSLKGSAAKANYFDEESYEEYWVSNPRKDGNDSLFPLIIEVDEDVRDEYWQLIRNEPDNSKLTSYKSVGKSKKEREAV